MLVVRAALGKLLPYHSKDVAEFDSLVGAFGIDMKTRFREFIVKDDFRCCVEYVIHYHRE